MQYCEPAQVAGDSGAAAAAPASARVMASTTSPRGVMGDVGVGRARRGEV